MAPGRKDDAPVSRAPYIPSLAFARQAEPHKYWVVTWAFSAQRNTTFFAIFLPHGAIYSGLSVRPKTRCEWVTVYETPEYA
jgi:hypothetical protein